MKRTFMTFLGWVALGFGILLAVVTVLLLFNGKMSVAGIFVIPTLALGIAGSNLLEYAKNKKTTT